MAWTQAHEYTPSLPTYRRFVGYAACAWPAQETWRLKLLKQSMGYSLVGGAQFLLDWGVLVGLTALGMPASPANVVGRFAGAALGYWANGRVTFPDSRSSSRRRVLRFALLWLLMTILSTFAIHTIAAHGSLAKVWLLKPLVEGALAVLTFFACRHWVYR